VSSEKLGFPGLCLKQGWGLGISVQDCRHLKASLPGAAKPKENGRGLVPAGEAA